MECQSVEHYESPMLYGIDQFGIQEADSKTLLLHCMGRKNPTKLMVPTL
jgi:hypothetical protein